MSAKRKPKSGNGNHMKKFQPKNNRQQEFADVIEDCKVSVGVGPAGTGKSFVALYKAAELYSKGEVQKIVLTRPALGVDEDTGFLPGTIEEKFGPWARPIMMTLSMHMGVQAFEAAVKKGDIEILPLQFMRGFTFHNSIVIMDEAQNATHRQMKMFLTRIGEGSKMVLVGDPDQSDLVDSFEETALEFVANTAQANQSETRDAIKFTDEDVVRDPECAFWGNEFKKQGVF